MNLAGSTRSRIPVLASEPRPGAERRRARNRRHSLWVVTHRDAHRGRLLQAEGRDNATTGGVGVVRQGDDALVEPDFDAVATADGGRGAGAAA